MKKLSFNDLKIRKETIKSCQHYPNCNAFKKTENGDIICSNAQLCQIEMQYIDLIEKILKQIEKQIEIHMYSTMNAPYFGWTGEFINGYNEALKKVKKDIEEIKTNNK